MSTRQTLMLSFFGNGSTPFEEFDVLDEGPTATKKSKASFNCQYNQQVTLKVRIYFNW